MKAIFDSAFQCEKCGWVWSDENVMAEHEKDCSGKLPKEGYVDTDVEKDCELEHCIFPECNHSCKGVPFYN